MFPDHLWQVAPEVRELTTKVTLESLREESQRKSEDHRAQFRYGLALLLRKESKEAVEVLDSAVSMNPSEAQYRAAYGESLMAVGRGAIAISEFRRAWCLGWSAGLPRLASVMTRSGDREEALILLKNGLAKATNDSKLLSEFINTLAPSFRWPELLATIQREVVSTYPEATLLCVMLESLIRLGRPEEVIECAEWARGRMREQDRLLALHHGRVMAGDVSQGRASLMGLLKCGRPSTQVLIAHLSFLQRIGDQNETDRLFWLNWPFRHSMGREFEGRPEWDAAPGKGQKILLTPSGYGFGDCLASMRFAHLVRRRGATPVVMCQAALRRLASTLPDVDHIVAPFDSVPAFDYWLDADDLRQLFGLSLEAAGAMTPYLNAHSDLLTNWRHRVNGTGLRVGLCWRSETEHNTLENPYSARDVPLAGLRPLLSIPGVSFFSLQYAATHSELVVLRELGIIDLGSHFSDFADTAAAITCLDLIVCVDTSVAHLAGALARPTFLLLPFMPDRRWMVDRRDSPWYPTFRLFRQPKPHDWSHPIEEVVLSLRALASEQAHKVASEEFLTGH